MIKVERSYNQVALFLVLMLGTFLANMIFVYPCKFSSIPIRLYHLTKSISLSYTLQTRYLCWWMVPDLGNGFCRCHDLLLSDRLGQARLHEGHIKDSICAPRGALWGEPALPTLRSALHRRFTPLLHLQSVCRAIWPSLPMGEQLRGHPESLLLLPLHPPLEHLPRPGCHHGHLQ